ncbi:uncharacterized protein LOC133778477 [Humulus lupulus]|uniref:uncharacterized protein LOC133778477 n=1 Tax=Humulus lupulus TaxID=3486 RepID=UPI002B4066DC|nr:uncharacterized protein LOC133778477 [Humulus lupulus]
MATAANFSGRVAPWNTWGRKPSPKTGIKSLAVKTTCRLDGNRLRREQHSFPWQRNGESKLLNGHKFNPLMASRRSTNNDSNSNHDSPSDLIKDFYVCINEKNMRKLGDYISADCYLEECSFPNPIDGKEEVFRFFKRLMTSMGDNVKFNVQHVCQEDDQLIAAAKWHLEWKKSQIPFTRGCSFFECAEEGDKLRIIKARIVIESPLKPGGYVLSLLKVVTGTFDDFPRATEWFLKSPHVILSWVLKIYSISLGLFINPILKSYVHLWNLATYLQSYVFQFVLKILKLFLK